MRQSSNDLTNMVRLYVATGQPRYREYYEEILAIRTGAAPRPRGYGSLVLGPRAGPRRAGLVRTSREESLTAADACGAASRTPSSTR